MKEIYERVVELAEYYRVSKPSEFAKRTGFSHQVATNYLKGKRNPTRESINTILVAFPEVNSDWLLTGNGSMLKTMVSRSTLEKALPDEILNDQSPKQSKVEAELELIKKLYQMQEELLIEVKKDRDRLQRLIDEKQNRI